MRAMLALLLVVMAVLWSAVPVPAQGPPNFAGKTVTIIVGYPPGGGYDIVARMALTIGDGHCTRRIVFASDQCFSRP